MDYTAFIEHCGNEGEKWITFVAYKGNESFINQLRALCDKYSSTEYEEEGYLDDGYLKYKHKPFSKEEVDVLISTGELFELSGYDDLYKKVDKILDISLIENIESFEDFVSVYYKRGLFD